MNGHAAAYVRNYCLDHLQVDPSQRPAARVDAIEDSHQVVDPGSTLSSADGTSSDAAKKSYWFPDDKKEQRRLNHQHRIARQILGGKLGRAPVRNPRNVLDVASGTGIWALDYARENPECSVVGIDISKIQPVSSLANCRFLICDAERDDWEFASQFDYIHFRYIVTCFDDLVRVLQKAYQSLRPGGFVEIFDIPAEFQCLDGTLIDTAYEPWREALFESLEKLKRDGGRPYDYPQYLEKAGFVQVKRTIVAAPLNEWPLDPVQKQIGRDMTSNYLQIADNTGLIMASAGLDAEKIHRVVSNAKVDICRADIHAYHEMTSVYGMKPFEL